MLEVTPHLRIPEDEFAWSYVRAGGPGGQNVNKVASKAVLRFDLGASSALPPAARLHALTRLGSRLTRDGALVLSSDAYRDQPRNRAAVLERLRALLAEAVAVPKRRRPTRPSRAARERRLTEKRQHGERKRERARHGED